MREDWNAKASAATSLMRATLEPHVKHLEGKLWELRLEALTAERQIMPPGWTHSGKARRAAE